MIRAMLMALMLACGTAQASWSYSEETSVAQIDVGEQTVLFACKSPAGCKLALVQEDVACVADTVFPGLLTMIADNYVGAAYYKYVCAGEVEAGRFMVILHFQDVSDPALANYLMDADMMRLAFPMDDGSFVVYDVPLTGSKAAIEKVLEKYVPKEANSENGKHRL
jgi:hypothetical protein